MTKTSPRLVSIGNALVDILTHVDEAVLTQLGIHKGAMNLVDMDRAQMLYANMNTRIMRPGGAAANTAIVAAELGLDTHYVSKVSDDEMGHFFQEHLEKHGVFYNTPLYASDQTGRCLIFISPDFERSMNTFLGASEFLSIDDIDTDAIRAADYLYLEGYRFDGPHSQEAFTEAVIVANESDTIAAIALSDRFCVERHFEAFHRLIEHGIDFVFCNELELIAYTQKPDLVAACESLRYEHTNYICTVGAAGVFLVGYGNVTHVPTHPVEAVDTTGAGDGFAGAFLAGLSRGWTLQQAAVLGCQIAGEIVQVAGAILPNPAHTYEKPIKGTKSLTLSE